MEEQASKMLAYICGVGIGFLGATLIYAVQWIISKASEEDDL